MAVNAVKTKRVSVAMACRTFQISETCYRYERKFDDESAEIAEWLVRLTTNRKTWGFGLSFLYLRNVKSFGWNHKRVYRIYCGLECAAVWLRPVTFFVRIPKLAQKPSDRCGIGDKAEGER